MPQELIVYIDGRFVPESQATISIYDRGFLLGDVVTESTRTFGYRPFRLRDHLNRLALSLKATQITPAITMDELEQVTLDLLERNRGCFGPDDDTWIVHDISRGMHASGRRPGRTYPPATVVIHMYPVDQAGLARPYREGVHVVVPSIRQLPPQCVDPKIKHRSRMHMTLASLEVAQVDPAAHTVLLDLEGNLTEGTGANFFIVAAGVVRTPDSRSALRGISRATVIELCARLDIPCREESLQLYDAIVADEAFLTSTPYCLLPVTRLNGRPVGAGRPGLVTRRILDGWSRLVGIDIVGQAERHASQAEPQAVR